MRKRVVLSNTNALDVAGLENISAAQVDKLDDMQGKMLGLDDATVDALRALEAFKPTQGWNLFRRPATLVRRETVELAQAINTSHSTGNGVAKIVSGDRGTGKSVLALQGMAMAHAKGWIVIHIPEARELTSATNSYEPLETPSGIVYMQPHFTAHLLSNILNANKTVLSKLQINQQHKLPIPIQANISLSRFIEFGANDPQLAYPIWQAFLSEITAKSRMEGEGQLRPSVFFSLDGLDHIMRATAYLDTELNLIHAHDLALVRGFNNLLTGKTALPNGGIIIGTTSASNHPSTPTLDHCLEQSLIQPFASWAKSLFDRISSAEKIILSDLELPDQTSLSVSHPVYSAYSTFLYATNALSQDVSSNTSAENVDRSITFEGDFKSKLATAAASLASNAAALVPKWDPYVEIDERVETLLRSVQVQRLFGLGKAEARGVIEYYAMSGMLRETVTEGLVSEKWSLAGKGIVGELERGSVVTRF